MVAARQFAQIFHKQINKEIKIFSNATVIICHAFVMLLLEIMYFKNIPLKTVLIHFNSIRVKLCDKGTEVLVSDFVKSFIIEKIF